ncbi:hypothetical protein A2738_02835 [Candidatus Nomurabacteria bacterium RIFCSPHIGHO2_01_FULL_42_15]|uniref:Uncharacterized protein n=1 Tax=Candidatus Nomurabacteria bacterium RIFCSPHIGHO2_01_FULL_42_15 TaxID=1801742 RepID=A0A1F6VEV4_9BACT|nr:MAG: hypothetical protein A2738_02835 [Candidatus Nomurabacteria bacterium RIFCSPHIGHO2_01_FULL_42_15]OGI92804.1 MAG: hypothetical protein A3A99_02900 [Candidatus Nomurabacteria bacterium RIFCSPLOWO2_01_FULL_41_18]
MLPKKNRVTTKEVEKIFKVCPPNGEEGKFVVSPNLTFKYFKNDDREKKISFLAPKNVAKLAVQRNFLRRRGYLALQKTIDQFPAGVRGVFIFKRYQDDVLVLENEIKNTLSKIN